jgi:hypothetical protein
MTRNIWIHESLEDEARTGQSPRRYSKYESAQEFGTGSENDETAQEDNAEITTPLDCVEHLSRALRRPLVSDPQKAISGRHSRRLRSESQALCPEHVMMAPLQHRPDHHGQVAVRTSARIDMVS